MKTISHYVNILMVSNARYFSFYIELFVIQLDLTFNKVPVQTFLNEQ